MVLLFEKKCFCALVLLRDLPRVVRVRRARVVCGVPARKWTMSGLPPRVTHLGNPATSFLKTEEHHSVGRDLPQAAVSTSLPLVSDVVQQMDKLLQSKASMQVGAQAMEAELGACQAEAKRARQRRDRAEADKRELARSLPRLREALGKEAGLRRSVAELRGQLVEAKRGGEEAEGSARRREAQLREAHKAELDSLRAELEARADGARRAHAAEMEREAANREEALRKTREDYGKVLEELKGKILSLEQENDRIRRQLKSFAANCASNSELNPNGMAGGRPAHLMPPPVQAKYLAAGFAKSPSPRNEELVRRAPSPNPPLAVASKRTAPVTPKTVAETPSSMTGSSKKRKRVSFDPLVVSSACSSNENRAGPAPFVAKGTTSDLFGLPSGGCIGARTPSRKLEMPRPSPPVHPAVTTQQPKPFTPGKTLMQQMRAGQKRKLYNPGSGPEDIF